MFENEKELFDHIPNPACIHVPVYFTDPKKIHKSIKYWNHQILDEELI